MREGFATQSERALVLSIVKQDFGEVAESIVLAILRADHLKLNEIVDRVHGICSTTKPSIHKIKCNLLKLLQHNILVVQAASPSLGERRNASTFNTVASYKIDVDEVLYRLRFPKFIEQAKEAFGQEGEVIMEELLVHGRVRIDQSVDSMAYTLVELKKQQDGDASINGEEFTEIELAEAKEKIHSTLIEMAKKRYISRIHPLNMTPPSEVEKAEFPDSIAKGMGTKLNGDNTQDKSSGVDSRGDKGTEENDDGITVRASKRSKISDGQGDAVPVELQMMLEDDEAHRKADDSDAEVEFDSTKGSRSRGAKKRKLSKKAKLPTRGAGGASALGEESDGSNTLGEKCLVWRYGIDQLMRDLRHRACIQFAKENINVVAGVVVGAMLKHSSPHEREKNEDTSFPVTVRDLFEMPEVRAALPKDSKDTWRLLLNYITVMCRDKSGMVMKVAAETFDPNRGRAGDGGQYVVHMKKIVGFLKLDTSHSYIQERFGVQSARIVRLLMEKRQLEQKTIGELALLPSNDARKRLYELYAENLVKMQEIPKRADHNPAFTIFCWSVDVSRLELLVSERIQDSLTKLRRRRKHEAEENKELIARSDQLVESKDLTKFDKLSRALDRLDRSVLQLDHMLMLYKDF